MLTFANPFVRLYQAPVETLTAFAYTLLLLAVSIALGGVAYHYLIKAYLDVVNRADTGNYAPRWEYVPPLRVFAYLTVTAFLAAVELALIAGMIYMLG